MPKVSVIVPVYNTEKYLEKCLNSLVNQTLKDIEIIIINDGSTDNSVKIINEYKEEYPQIIQVISKKNEGQAIARNIGIEKATGEYVGFLDSDDYAEISMYETLYESAVSQNVDMVLCAYYLVSEEKSKVISFAEKRKEELLIDPKAAPWNKLYKTELVKESGVRFHPGLIYEDTAFYANMIPHLKNYRVVNTPLLYHLDFRNGATTCVASLERFTQMFPIMDGILDYYKTNNFFELYKDELEYFYSKMLLGSSFKRMASISDRGSRSKFLRLSYKKVVEKFPQFACNPYYKNKVIGIYMRCMNNVTAPFFGDLYYIIKKINR